MGYLSREAAVGAREAFLRYMAEHRLTYNLAYPGKRDPERARILEATGLTDPVTCQAVLKRLQNAWNGSKTSEGTLRLAAYLLGKSVNEIQTTRRPSTIPPGAGRFVVDGPSRSDGHCVLLGELPTKHHHAVVFARPVEHEWLWPQHHPTQPDPRVGRAFTVLVRLGNPGGVFHEGKLPGPYEVRVYATDFPWRSPSDPVHQEELQGRLEELGVAAGPTILRIERTLGPKLVTLTGSSQPPLVHVTPRSLTTRAPLTISWDPDDERQIEIYSAFRDHAIGTYPARSGLRLTLDGKDTPPNQVALPEPGTYRIKIFPTKHSFLDTDYEYWVDIQR